MVALGEPGQGHPISMGVAEKPLCSARTASAPPQAQGPVSKRAEGVAGTVTRTHPSPAYLCTEQLPAEPLASGTVQ